LPCLRSGVMQRGGTIRGGVPGHARRVSACVRAMAYFRPWTTSAGGWPRPASRT
jgi:hypothetical protein